MDFLMVAFPFFMVLIGFVIGYINGALGIGYGVISTSLLLAFGITPLIASASTRMAKIFITLAAGVSHWKFGNLRKDIGIPMILPGAIGGVLGAFTLYLISTSYKIKPIIAGFLFFLGLAVFFQFLFRKRFQTRDKAFSKHKLWVLAFLAAFSDALFGGGWGPLTTPILILSNKSSPRKVIGSMDTTAFFVTLAETLTFIWLLDIKQFRWDWILALIISGGLAAPIAASMCGKVRPRLLGLSLGLILILTNLWTIITLLF